jgi:hypothetical protein
VVPHLVAKEFVVALVLTGLVFIISALWDAPLLDRANPSLSPNPAKAPWYFLGIQELLMHFHPFFAAFVFPSLFLGAIIWFPFTGFRDQDGGTWFASQRGQRLVMKTSLATVFLIVGLVLLEEWIPEYTKESGTWSWFFEGVLPSGIILMLTILWIFLLHRKFGYQKSEIAQGVFVFYTVAYVVLTIFGIWFRGEGMALVWPWLR